LTRFATFGSRAGSEAPPGDAPATARRSIRSRDLGLNLAVAALYWAVAELTLLPSSSGGVRVMPLWPSSGVALAAVLLGGWRLLPGVAIGSGATALLHLPAAAVVPIALGDALQVLINVHLLRRAGFDERLERVRDPLVLCAATVAGSAAAAVLGLVAFLVSGAPEGSWWQGCLTWWMRHWLGTLVIGSLIVCWARSRPIAWTWRRAAEALVVLVALLASSQMLFGLWSIAGQRDVPFAFVLFPIVGYTGLRFGPAGAATVTALAAAFAIPIAALGVGPFAAFTPGVTLVLLHAYLLLAWISGQTLAAVRAEWAEALQRRVALEEQLRHSQKMEAVGRLAGGIAHDFNNLLTAIIGYTEILMVGFEPGDPRRADAEEIARAAMRAADLTRQMLAFSRRQVLQPRILDLNATLMKVEPMLRRVIGEDIIMTIAPRAQHPQVRVDPGQIEQVIMNLVVNARDAMPRGGRLTVETADALFEPGLEPPEAHPGPYVMLAVSDTGVGMTPEVRARIFEPYFTTKEVGKGTGLGLSTAYGIVRQSEGFIQVNSEPGLGTTFRIYLPRVAAAVATADAAGEEHMPGGNEHVLLVEDDPSVRRLTRDILVRLGYSVTEAASGRAGIALGSDDTRHFDLALCDVILGDMSGPAVYEALRALRPHVRVLYMSGYADEAIVRTGVLEEGQPFLQKPFTPRELAVKIREVLERTGEE
jgi:signal transduction histidine kinase/CheY-like chemotaxis protein